MAAAERNGSTTRLRNAGTKEQPALDEGSSGGPEYGAFFRNLSLA
jgi:hypothetical protein